MYSQGQPQISKLKMKARSEYYWKNKKNCMIIDFASSN